MYMSMNKCVCVDAHIPTYVTYNLHTYRKRDDNSGGCSLSCYSKVGKQPIDPNWFYLLRTSTGVIISLS